MITYEYLQGSEVDVVYQLIARVFKEHIAPEYSPEGVERFFNHITRLRIKELLEGKDSFVLAAKQDGHILGMLAIKNESHISLIFVDSKFQGKGVGKRLVEEAIKICKQRNPKITSITVNSSPNSETFYEGIGFNSTDRELSDHGLRFKPMKKEMKKNMIESGPRD